MRDVVMRFWLPVLVLASLPVAARGQAATLGLKVADGFEVTEFAGANLANDIYCMTVDAKGRLVVAGRGYIRILVDADADGKADKYLPFATTPKDGAMGLLWEGDTLLATGDGGLRQFVDGDGDGRADGPSKLIRALKTGREHGAHALRRGPDGWLYVLCGNNTDIDAGYARLPTSPVKKPVAGCVLRFSPDLKHSEIVAHGFRNPYGMDFNTDGELFTYDSDNERCVSLPWYEHTRFYHVMPGGFYGWLNPQHAQFWRCPPYFVDVVAPATTLGRGSPTGVACYRHVQFPPKYRGGMFALDWTFGKVYFLGLSGNGSTYACAKEVFLQATGDNGFAPTDVVVHPETGDLFIAIGGRGTRGAVYRVRYKGGSGSIKESELAKLQMAQRSLDWQPALAESLPAAAMAPNKLERRRALELLLRHQGHFSAAQLRDAIAANWDEPDRYIRQAAAALAAALPEAALEKLWQQAKSPRAVLTLALARIRQQPGGVLEKVQQILALNLDAETRLEALRLAQLCLGDLVAPKQINSVWEGYSARSPAAAKQIGPEAVHKLLTNARGGFAGSAQPVDLEAARLFAVLEDANQEMLDKIVAAVSSNKNPVVQLHYLMVLARLSAFRDAAVATKVADALLGLDVRIKQAQMQTDSHWPLRLKELYAGLAAKDDRLNHALLQHPDFGRPAHALFALSAGFDVNSAATLCLKKAKADIGYAWNGDVVQVVGQLPKEQSLITLRALWGKAGLEAALLPILAKHAEPQDRPKFVAGLKSTQLATVQTCLDALKKQPAKTGSDEILALLFALNRLPKDKAKSLAQDLTQYLEDCTGEKRGADRQAWIKWFSGQHPALAAKLTNPDGIDVAAWKKRLTHMPWQGGEAKRGAAAFQKANCATCHSGSQALGPDLQGVAKRFSQEGLFWSVVQPSREISDRYQVTLFDTHDGKLYQGLVVYEATDGVMLQTGATTTVRIAGDNIAGQQPLTSSLMPSGLLDNLSDQEIVDLFAYLREL